MNVLILTGRFGMGHYSVAEAVKEDVLNRNPGTNVNIVDIVDHLFPTANKGIYKGFDFMVSKLSKVYNFLNIVTGKYSKVPLQRSLVRKINQLILQYNADIVVCTVPGSSQYISSYKEVKKSNIPLYTYITDIGVHGEWLADNTDIYFVSGQTTKKELLDRGVPEEKIIVSGIPVKLKFKNTLHQDHISEKVELLIMGGGLGLIPSSDELLAKLSELDDINVTLIAGKNEDLLNSIKKDFPKINAIGYTTEVNEYMKKADLLITKPGGVTTFEAIYSEVPLYIVNPFLVQEIYNAKFIERVNIGKVAWKDEDIVNEVVDLVRDKQLLEEMKENMRIERNKLYDVSPVTIYNERGAKVCI